MIKALHEVGVVLHTAQSQFDISCSTESYESDDTYLLCIQLSDKMGIRRPRSISLNGSTLNAWSANNHHMRIGLNWLRGEIHDFVWSVQKTNVE